MHTCKAHTGDFSCFFSELDPEIVYTGSSRYRKALHELDSLIHGFSARDMGPRMRSVILPPRTSDVWRRNGNKKSRSSRVTPPSGTPKTRRKICTFTRPLNILEHVCANFRFYFRRNGGRNHGEVTFGRSSSTSLYIVCQRLGSWLLCMRTVLLLLSYVKDISWNIRRPNTAHLAYDDAGTSR